MPAIRSWLRFTHGLLTLSCALLAAASTSSCPGYVASNVVEDHGKLTAELKLAGEPCHTYGYDVEDLVLEVSYDTKSRLHVKISDAAGDVYRVPPEVLDPPSGEKSINPLKADLRFDFVKKPFSFSVTRNTNDEVLFNTSSFPLIFQSQYLFLRTALPENPNIYGLGEHTDPFHLPTTNHTRTLWSRDAGDVPPNTNVYGNHPVYYDHRGAKGTHAVFFFNSNGMDVKLNKTAEEGQTLSYNTIGGIADLYFMSGPTPVDAVQQYSEVVGKSAMMPYWGLGFHQCAYNYPDAYYLAEVIANYSSANIPLQTMWTDINYMDGRKIFSLDPMDFPLNLMQQIVDYLHKHGQHYILMLDPAVAYQNYGPFNRGVEDDVFLETANGSIYKGVVWPGVTAFPDWFAPKVQSYWDNEFVLFFDPKTGVDIDGLWIDMNEASNFCDYPCADPEGSAATQSLPPPPFPTRVPPPIKGFPPDFQPPKNKRAEGAGEGKGLPGRDLIHPLYKIQNFNGDLSSRTIDTSLIHANGLTEYDVHNAYGTMMSSRSYDSMLHRRPKSRPYIITRSTFAGAGSKVGHWLGDNRSTWEQYRRVLGGMLNFASLFQLPMVGADTCGFNGYPTEILCSRWAMLGAFSPFFRNHNANGVYSPQEFYVWPDTVAVAARKAIAARYKLLDYFYTALYTQSVEGTPSLNPLWFIYPEDTNTYPIEYQYFYGDALLISPVIEENATHVDMYLPNDIFYDFWTYKPVKGHGKSVNLKGVEITDIPVHIRGGRIVPMRIESAMTTTELRNKDFDIVVAPGLDGRSRGQLYLDDGDSQVQDSFSLIDLEYNKGHLQISGKFDYEETVNIAQVTLLGVDRKPRSISVNGSRVRDNRWHYNAKSSSVIVKVSLPLTKAASIQFKLDG